jgi:hypothetical protein
MGVEVTRGDPRDNRPGQHIVIPAHPSQFADVDVDLDHVRRSYLHDAIDSLPEDAVLGDVDLDFLAAETRSSRHYVQEILEALRGKTG